MIVSRDDDFCPRERATAKMVLSASDETRATLSGLRRRFSFFLVDMMCLMAKENDGDAEAQLKTNGSSGLISSDSKICKEVIELVELILTRRGQKELLCDFVAASQTDYIASVLFRCSDALYKDMNVYFKDGEDGGKVVCFYVAM